MKQINSLSAVRSALKERGGRLEQCFRWGAREWCPWLPNPRYPGFLPVHDLNGNVIGNVPESEMEPHGIYEQEPLIEWARENLS